MLKKRWLLLAVLGLCVLGAPADAQKEKKAERSKEEIQKERLRRLITAHDLAAQGRAKNAPEYLIAAAGILRQLSTIKDLTQMKKLDTKVEVTGGDKAAPGDKEIAKPSLAQQSDDLFKEASDMGATLNVNVDRLIKLARDRAAEEERKRPEGERDVVGGPRNVYRAIGPHQTHSYRITVKGNRHMQFMTGFGLVASHPVRVTVVHDGIDSVWADGYDMIFEAMWRPQTDCVLVIRVNNPHPQPAQYEMLVQ